MALRVIVFGPTGNVASIVARTAQRNGAKVFLAMRDTKKSIPGLSPKLESEGDFERVQANLTQPASVLAAIAQTRATSAFMYLAWHSSDHMKATLEASKAAGINFIVFLSSFTITKKLEEVPESTRIPYAHARVEMNLEEIFGHENYVALRAGAFATNTLRWRAGIDSGEVILESPHTEYDFITPTDMGRVGGKILVNGQSDGQHVVYLYGPQLMAQKDALAVVIKSLGKEIEVNDSKAQTNTTSMTQSVANAQRVVVRLGQEGQMSDWFKVAYNNFEEGIDNIVRYTGQPGTSFKKWVEESIHRESVL